MLQRKKGESDLQWAIRKTATHMPVFTGVTNQGKMFYTINDHQLTAEQILHLDSRGKLTRSGIAEFARQCAEGNKS